MLRCECGGSLELQDATGGPESFFEMYRCTACGRSGGFRAGKEESSTSGCVTRV